MATAETDGFGDQLRRGREEVRGLGGELAGLAGDVRAHARSEVELAKAEMGEQAGIALRMAIWGGVALVTAVLALVFVFLTVMFAISVALPLWAAALITTALLLAIAGAAGALAYLRLRQISVVPRRTVRSLKEDVRWARDQLRSSTSSSASGAH
ncbi:MAG: phage holin family protein [Dehalococcoidia bacterium]|nr:phage holin family protein [Dehalococcoidia bacterium]